MTIKEQALQNAETAVEETTELLLSCVILYNDDDSGFVHGCLRTLPNYAEVILMKTKQVPINVTTSPDGQIIIDNPRIEPFNVTKSNDGKITMMEMEYKDLDLADLRNIAKKYAGGKWILSIDPDERLMVHQHEDLKKMLDNVPQDCGALTNVNVGWYNGEIDSETNMPQWHLIHQVRIFRNKSEFTWRSMIHEDIKHCIINKGYKIYPSETIIHHLGYKRTPEQLMNKLVRNIKGLVKQPELTLQDNQYFNYLIRECASVAALRKEIENANKKSL